MIDSDIAIEIARKHAAEKGWAFPEPVEIVPFHGWFGGLKRFEIETNAGQLGTKSYFVIDAATGEIVSAGYIPR
ncbi:hypothetical protein [Candidatus Thiosymbion oneisti]|uniref:hypothetical protein n=1 Tax=Candidatus Thiosymbion oneisti TaxID=589554 RepID=UPI00105CEEAF|nr:hypothetical protein [Candidatus Thiosymbion oneisti]